MVEGKKANKSYISVSAPSAVETRPGASSPSFYSSYSTTVAEQKRRSYHVPETKAKGWVHSPPCSPILQRHVRIGAFRRDAFKKELAEAASKLSPKAQEIIATVHNEIEEKDYGFMRPLEKEWCMGLKWRFRMNFVQRSLLRKLWNEQFSPEDKKDILSVEFDDVLRFIKKREMVYFFDHTASDCNTNFRQNWPLALEQNKTDEIVFENPEYLKDFFLRVRKVFVGGLTINEDSQIFFNYATKNFYPDLQILWKNYHADTSVEKNQEAEANLSRYMHLQKIVVYASLHIMEKKLIALAKRTCALCGEQDSKDKAATVLEDQTESLGCPKCEYVHYCSSQCQQKDLKAHQESCKKVLAVREMDRAGSF